MRILHFSDLHIGVENYGRIDPATGLSTRLGDFLDSLEQVVEFALTQKVDLVLLAGDVYKGRDPSQTHQREFARRIHRISTAGIPVFLLVGNHDLPNSSSRANAVEIFPTLAVPGVHIGSNLQTYAVNTPAGPLQIIAIPWPRRGGLLTREESRGLNIDEVRAEMERRMTDAIAARIAELDPSIPAILTGHFTINGATIGTERSMMLGNDHVLLTSAVHRPELDYVALGHIHKHQIIRREPPMVVYSDPRRELVEQLLEYQRFKRLSEALAEQQRQAHWIITRSRPRLLPEAVVEQEQEEVQLAPDDLLAAFKEIVAAIGGEQLTSLYEEFTVKEKIALVHERLALSAAFSFLDLVRGGSALEIICAFWAVLELAKTQAVAVIQRQPFAAITVQRAGRGGGAPGAAGGGG